MPSVIETNDLDAIIIGAGFGGCYLLRNLRKQGFKVRVFEEGEGLGGVWWHNRYPGARVDTSAPIYEFSDPELWGEWEWTEAYPSQSEILKYFQYVDRKWDLSRDITFGARVTEASFNPEENQWTVYTSDGRTASARFLLPAIGFASKTYTPNINGLSSFEGFACHTGHWPEEVIDFKGKRVGVIGTGATGVQIIQELGPVAGELVVFQRSPNCTLPMCQKPFTAEAFNKKEYPEKFKLMKTTHSGFPFTCVPRRCIDDTPEQQLHLYECLWKEGGFAPSYGNYYDFSSSLDANNVFYNFWRDKVRARISRDDPELIENLAPTKPPFPFGTKRPSLEQTYYEVFNQENVKLIALKKNPIAEVVPKGVMLADKTMIELDALILATGFDAITGSFSRIKITGLKKQDLNAKWNAGCRTFLGMTAAGFPNMFFLYGPQSPTAAASGPVVSEIQGDWIIKTLVYMRNKGLTRIDAQPNAENEWARFTNELCNQTLLPLNETTWYMGANIPGKTREALHFVGGLPKYQDAMEKCVMDKYAGFTLQ